MQLENTDGVRRPPVGSPHQCPLESVVSYLCHFMLTCGLRIPMTHHILKVLDWVRDLIQSNVLPFCVERRGVIVCDPTVGSIACGRYCARAAQQSIWSTDGSRCNCWPSRLVCCQYDSQHNTPNSTPPHHTTPNTTTAQQCNSAIVQHPC